MKAMEIIILSIFLSLLNLIFSLSHWANWGSVQKELRAELGRASM